MKISRFIHQICFRPGLRFAPDPTGEAHDASPDPLVGNSGLTPHNFIFYSQKMETRSNTEKRTLSKGRPEYKRKRQTTPSTQKSQTLTQKRDKHGVIPKIQLPIEE